MDSASEKLFIYLKQCDNSPEQIFLKTVSLVTRWMCNSDANTYTIVYCLKTGLKCHCYDN